MSLFDRAFMYLIHNEGVGPVKQSQDPGGLTKYGISQRSYPHINIANLTESQAKEIYRRDYWIPLRCDDIKDPVFAVKFFDTSVNVGTYRGIVLLQQVVSFFRPGQLTVDGRIGEKTLEALNTLLDKDPKYHRLLVRAYSAHLWGFYARIVQESPSRSVYSTGWSERAFRIPSAFDVQSE